MHLLIVEDHDLLSFSLAVALRASGHRVTVLHPRDDAHVRSAMVQAPDAVLLDLDLGDGVSSGEDLVGEITARGITVVVVTGSTDLVRIHRCLDAGASGFVPKSRGVEALEEALRRSEAGEAVTDESDLRRLDAAVESQRAARRRQLAAFDSLTPRERGTLAALMDGRTVEEIARTEVVSVATVRSHVRGVLGKLGVSSQVAAVALAYRLEWTSAD